MALRPRLTDLEAALLPAVQDPLGNYPAEQVVKTEAFLVLAHSAFEKELEDACKGAVKNAEAAISSGTATKVALAISSYYSVADLPTNVSWAQASSSLKKKLMLEGRVALCFEMYLAQVKSSHGIKTSNLTSILCPLGFDMATIPPADLVELDNFGEVRGNLAHGRAQQIIDPFSEKATTLRIEQIINRLVTAIGAL
jgi:hypothetical protein